jgi:hypothetical protein
LNEEEELEQALMHMYELGLVSVEYDEDLTARFRITDEGLLRFKELRGNTDDV